MSGDLSDDIISTDVEKSLELVKTHKRNKKYEHPKYAKFNSKTNKWELIDVTEEIIKKHHNKKK